jgi:ElaB/YqjD/DUF883 family membrane-anchored ribosome-binding protein
VAARSKAQRHVSYLDAVQDSADDLQTAVQESMTERPYVVLGLAVGAGILLGLFFHR